jgi:hypothetical protein
MEAPPLGLEEVVNSPEKTGNLETGDAESDAVGARSDVLDADLARLTTLWPMLPDDARQAVLRLAEKSVMLPATD